MSRRAPRRRASSLASEVPPSSSRRKFSLRGGSDDALADPHRDRRGRRPLPCRSERLRQAALVVGGARHLALIGETEAERLAWPSPLHEAFPAILARRGQTVCVLASGDPFFFGVGSLLGRDRRRGRSSRACRSPRPSVSRRRGSAGRCRIARWSPCMAGRWSAIIPHLQPGARVLALSWDGETPQRLASLLCARGLGDSPHNCAGGDGRPARTPPLRHGLGARRARRRSPQHRRAGSRRRGRRAHRAARARPARRVVRERRPAHQARDARADDLRARAPAARDSLGRRRRLRLDRHRMAARRRLLAGRRRRARPRALRPHPSQRRRARRPAAAPCRGRSAGGARRAAGAGRRVHRRRGSRVRSRPAGRRSNRAGGSSSTR